MGLNSKTFSEKYSISPDAVANRMGDQIVVVHVGTDRIFELNSTAARIWDLLSQGHDQSEIQRIVFQEFKVPENAATQIQEFLDSLLFENMISLKVHEKAD